MTDLVKRLRSQIGQLRHAYMHLSGQTVKRQKEFADGLISPAIQEFEKAADEIVRLREALERIRDHEYLWPGRGPKFIARKALEGTDD